MRPDVFGGGRVKGEWGTGGGRRRTHDECGQVVVLFALLLPMLLALGAIVVSVGNWYTHARHLQTKVDAAAFAGGTAWGFPCGADIDANIEAQARLYVGSHTAADGTVVDEPAQPAAGRRRGRPDLREPQPGSMVERRLSGSRLLRSARPGVPVEDPGRKGDGGRHAAPLARHSVLPGHQAQGARPDRGDLGPHRAAADRRAPSAAAQRSGRLLRRGDDLEADPRCRAAPARVHRRRALLLRRRAGWSRTVDDGPDPVESDRLVGRLLHAAADRCRHRDERASGLRSRNAARTAPCLDTQASWVGQGVDAFCRQAGLAVQCFDADGSGATQTVASGLQLVRGHREGDVGDGPPDLRNAWLKPVDCPSTGYFNSIPGSCKVQLGVVVDIGSREEDVPGNPVQLVQTRIANHVEMRYCLVDAARSGPRSAIPTWAHFNSAPTRT